jgi:hypothetical protein
MSGLTSTNDVFGRVQKHLRPWTRDGQLTPDTELYRDLGMYGDDLAFDVVIWATREFGVGGSFHLTKYAPAEHSFPWLRRILRRLLGQKPRQYKSLTVSDVVAAIEAKRWPD